MHFDNIYNLGVKDNGISYNSYLITAQKNVLIDTVPQEYAEELVQNIEKIISIKKIDYIVLNHTEADRSGCVKKLIGLNKNIIVAATVAGLKNIKEQLNCEINEFLVKNNMKFSVDNENCLDFIITHNINWPDSMMTYHREKKVLFSCDAFSDESGGNNIKSYYDKKLSHLSDYVYMGINKLLDYEIEAIMPGNGNVIFDTKEAIENYRLWSKPGERDKKTISVIYESRSENTRILAQRVKETLDDSKVNVQLCNVSESNIDESLEFIYNSDGVIFATFTEHRNIPKKISEVIMAINHFKINDVVFAAFGSYGWSGEGANLIYSILRARHFDTFDKPFRFLFRASGDTIEKFDKYIMAFYEKVMIK